MTKDLIYNNKKKIPINIFLKKIYVKHTSYAKKIFFKYAKHTSYAKKNPSYTLVGVTYQDFGKGKCIAILTE